MIRTILRTGSRNDVHVLERSQRLEVPAQQAFEFFTDARNLEAITPPWLSVRTPGPRIDTSRGRPDIGAHVAERAPRFEAVFVVSNEQVRDEVTRVCEELDVPWYGPTFDS